MACVSPADVGLTGLGRPALRVGSKTVRSFHLNVDIVAHLHRHRQNHRSTASAVYLATFREIIVVQTVASLVFGVRRLVSAETRRRRRWVRGCHTYSYLCLECILVQTSFALRVAWTPVTLPTQHAAGIALVVVVGQVLIHCCAVLAPFVLRTSGPWLYLSGCVFASTLSFVAIDTWRVY